MLPFIHFDRHEDCSPIYVEPESNSSSMKDSLANPLNSSFVSTHSYEMPRFHYPDPFIYTSQIRENSYLKSEKLNKLNRVDLNKNSDRYVRQAPLYTRAVVSHVSSLSGGMTSSMDLTESRDSTHPSTFVDPMNNYNLPNDMIINLDEMNDKMRSVSKSRQNRRILKPISSVSVSMDVPVSFNHSNSRKGVKGYKLTRSMSLSYKPLTENSPNNNNSK